MDFDRMIAGRYKTDDSIEALLEQVDQVAGLGRLFRGLEREPDIASLLFTRVSVLFQVADDFLLATLPHTTRRSRRGRPNAARLKEMLADPQDKINWGTFVGLSADDMAKLGAQLGPVLAYVILFEIRRSASLRALIEPPTLSFAQVSAAFAEWNAEGSNRLSEAALELVGTPNAGDGAAMDVAAAHVAKRVLTGLAGGFAQNFDEMGLQMGDLLPNFMNHFHVVSEEWQSRILQQSGLSAPEYGDTLDTLFQRGLIESRNAITWCAPCTGDNLTFSQRRGNIPPERISFAKCWTCGKPESFGALYAVATPLRRIMFYKDGILSVYLAWLLRERGYQFEAGVTVGGREADFIVAGLGAFEVKMLQSREIKGSRQALSAALRQAAHAAQHAKAAASEVAVAVVVWNGPTPSDDEFQHIARGVDLDGLDARVVGASGVHKVLDGLKRG